MTIQVTLTLANQVYKHFQWLSDVTGEPIEAIMADSMADYTPIIDARIYIPVEQLSNAEVLALAELQMEAMQGQRLSDLSDKQQSEGLNQAEQTELSSLLHVYQVDLVRKSLGLREAVKRGLMKPLTIEEC